MANSLFTTSRSLLLAGALAFAALPAIAQTVAPSTQPAAPAAGSTVAPAAGSTVQPAGKQATDAGKTDLGKTSTSKGKTSGKKVVHKTTKTHTVAASKKHIDTTKTQPAGTPDPAKKS